MAGYTKEFLVSAAISKWKYYDVNTDFIKPLMEKHFDDVGRDKFRTATALDAAAIKDFKNTGYCNI